MGLNEESLWVHMRYQPDIMMHITLKHKDKNVISQEFREAFDEVDLIIGPKLPILHSKLEKN